MLFASTRWLRRLVDVRFIKVAVFFSVVAGYFQKNDFIFFSLLMDPRAPDDRSMEPIEMERSRGDVHFLLVSAIGHGKTLDASWSAADADGRQTRSPSARRDALWRHSKKKTCHLLSPILLKLLCSIRQGHSKTFDICKQTGGKVLFFFLLLIAADGQLLSLNGDDVRHYRLTVTNVNLEKSATRHEGLANKKGKTGGMGQQVNNRSVSIAVRHLAITPHCCVIIIF